MNRIGSAAARALASTAFAGLSLALPTAAWGQGNAPQAEPTPAQDCAAQPTEAERQACLDRERAATSAPATLPPTPAAQPGDDAIVVTGSRLRRTEFNSPDPVTIINIDTAEKKGQFDTAEIVQSAPIAAGSTQITSALSSNFVTNGGEGSELIDLRGLGPNRTLSLINGRRAGPAGVRGGVSSFDLNVLPSSVLASVEILKTGASSIYGSDAVAGVVNFITKTSTDGIEIGGYSTIPLSSGAETYDVNATYGKRFARGHFLLSADYFHRNELARRDRPFLNCTEDYLFNQQGQRIDTTDPRTGKYACNNVQGPFIALLDFIPQILGTTNVQVGGVPVQVIQFNNPGDNLDRFVSPLAPPTNRFEFGSPPGFFPVFYDKLTTGLTNQFTQYEQSSSVIPETKRFTFYGDGSYQVTSGIELYTELLFNNRQTYTNATRQIFPLQFTSRTILPGALFGIPGTGDPINKGFTGDVILEPVAVTDQGADSSTNIDYYRGVLGARGALGGFLRSWHWDVYGQYSRSDGHYGHDLIFQDAMDPQTLRTASCLGTTTAIRHVPCMDINFTDPRVLAGNFTPAERAFLFGHETGRTIYTQWTGEANVTGNLLTLPAGKVQTALGVQWRRDAINDTPGPATLAGNVYGSSKSGVTAGRTVTAEAFGEVQVPLIHNTPLIRALDFSAAGRITNVTATRASDGFSVHDRGNWTYKLGVNWEVIPWVRLRATYGTSYRSPALFEQFLADETSFPQQPDIDPCIRWGTKLAQGSITQRLANNCAAAGVPANYVGGPDSAEATAIGGIGFLKPETSKAKTASVIFTPRDIWRGMRLSVAVDYFDIDVKGEIAQLGAAAIISGCYNSQFYPTDPLCSQFVRAPAGSATGPEILTISNPFLNINRQRNRGVDVTTRFVQDLGRLGTLAFQSQMTWQLEDRFELFAGTGADNNGKAGDPIWNGDFNLTWNVKPWTFFYNLSVIGGTSNLKDLLLDRGAACFHSNFYNDTVCPDVRLSPTFYHNASITVSVNKDYDFTLGVSNIFNKAPPRASSVFTNIGFFGQAPILGSQYDYLGRRVFVTVKGRF